MSDPGALPAGSFLLHVGPQKTGSTAIQLAMHHAREDLERRGVHVVGSRAMEREAGRAVLGVRVGVGKRPPRPEMWQHVVDDIRASTAPLLCLSNEDFGRADDAAVDRILDATGAERTHVVLVVRRLDRLLPSHWQERVKARSTLSYDDYLRDVLAPDPEGWHSRLLWDPLDIRAVADRWTRRLADRGRFVVVVADEDDRTVTTRAFETLLGLPQGLLVAPPDPANRSLGFTEAEAIRRLNQVTREEDWSREEYRNLVQLGVVKALKRRPAAPGDRLTGVPAWAFDRVAELADKQIEAIAGAGVRVLGDPESLRVRDRAQPAATPPDVEQVSLEVVADVGSGLRAGAARIRPPADVRAQRDNLGGRQLLQLLARRTAARLGVRRAP
jgi:hypothetical protein